MMLAKLTTTVSRTAMRQAMRPMGARFMSQRYTKSHEWVKVRTFLTSPAFLEYSVLAYVVHSGGGPPHGATPP